MISSCDAALPASTFLPWLTDFCSSLYCSVSFEFGAALHLDGDGMKGLGSSRLDKASKPCLAGVVGRYTSRRLTLGHVSKLFFALPITHAI